MEISSISSCQTCLGSLELPINLFDSCHKDYLEVFQRLLGLQLYADGKEFVICSQCQGKIIWVSEFQISCLKSLRQIGCFAEYKTEVAEIEDVETSSQCVHEIKEDRADCSGDDYTGGSDDDYEVAERPRTRRFVAKRIRTRSEKVPLRRSQSKSSKLKSRPVRKQRKRQSSDDDDSSSHFDDNSDSDSDCRINRASKKRKRKVNTISDDENDDGNANIEQFPSSHVLKAIANIDTRITATKNRTCVICDFIGRNAGVLRIHMKNKHENVKNWCRHCNLQFEDLPGHKDGDECNKPQCKFCKMNFTWIKHLRQHLKSHCQKNRDKTEKVQRGRRKEKVKRLKLQQFPASEVLQAIEDSRSYLNDIKNRQCVICDYVGADAGILQIHIGRKHEREFRRWCKHCNMVTQNLQEHRDSVRCYEQICKLCGDTFTKIKYLKQHLQQHCRTKLFQPAVDKLEKRSPKDDPKWKPCDQYPEGDVLSAIADCSAYMTDIKNRSCLNCDFVAPNSRMLSVHLSFKHKEQFKNWCCRCNLYAEDLQLHINDSKCTENRCVFCDKVFFRVNKLTTHLKLHCRTLIKADDEVDEDVEHDSDKATNLDSTLENDTGIEPVKKKKPKENPKWKPCDQFPEEQVLSAITDATAYMTDMKNRLCIYCHFTAPTSRNLSAHMRKAHKTNFSTWCNRCNLQTDDLKVHFDSTKCFENQCVLCNKMFAKVNRLTSHLKLHCHERFGIPGEILDDTNEPLPTASMDENTSLTNSNTDLPNNDAMLDQYGDSSFNTTDNNAYEVKTEYDADNKEGGDHKSDVSDHESPESSEDDSENGRNRGEKSLRIRRRALKQFSRNVVQKAIMETMKSFYTNRKCIKCGFLTSNRHRLITHMNSAHRDVKGKWCSRCNSIVGNLPKHWRSHENDILKCVLCGFTSGKTEFLKSHLKRHYRSKIGSRPLDLKAQWFCCKVCPASFIEEQQLKAHKCKDSSNTFVNCKLCKKHVRNIRLHNAQRHNPLNSHIQNVKGRKVKSSKLKPAKEKLKSDSIENHLCPVCGKTFKTAGGIAYHITSHYGETPFKCSICGKCFANGHTLNTHERRHSGVKPYVCHICGKGSFEKFAHLKHLEIHEDGGPVQCTICNQEFPRPGVLKLHMRRHTGENLYNCMHCGKSFHVKSLLRYHMRIHNEDRPYKCSYCGKGFKVDTTLRNHESIHTGEKPFRCNICTFCAVQAHALTTHMKQHPEDAPQGDRPHKCQFCYRTFSTNAVLLSHTFISHRKNTMKYVNKGM